MTQFGNPDNRGADYGEWETELSDEVTFKLYTDHHWGLSLRWNHNCIDNNGVKFRNNSSIPVEVEHPKHWDLVSVDPVTVSPSILCMRCNCHGFVTNGKWVSA